MPRSGLNRARLVEAAVQYIERHGVDGFSMRALADELNVKTASLYNHIDSMDALLVDVCAYALNKQCEYELNAIGDKHGAAAIAALSEAYRSYAKEHIELYRLIMRTAPLCGDKLNNTSESIVSPFYRALDTSPLPEGEKVHWVRTLRAIIHGFVSQEDAGFFAHLDKSADESFTVAVQCYVDGLKQAERRARQ